MDVINRVLPEGSALRDFVEVGSMLAAGVAIAFMCSRYAPRTLVSSSLRMPNACLTFASERHGMAPTASAES